MIIKALLASLCHILCHLSAVECPSDEFNCEGTTTVGNMFCISATNVCDGHQNCEANTDEDSTLCFQRNSTQNLVSTRMHIA